MRTVSVLPVLFGLFLLSAGCVRSPGVTFYTLTPAAVPEVEASSAQALSVRVGPVTLPELLDRPQLVVRVAPNRVAILESHRWAEPLKEEIPRLLSQDIGRRLGSNRVFAYGQGAGVDVKYGVPVDILRLEAVQGEAVTIEATWSVRRGSDSRVGRAVVREKTTGSGYDAVADATSRALDTISAEIVKTVLAAEAISK
ncbi:membrane integrity-associated transporter subunit PqiC [Geomonas terrae]|uniref:Membrane integrity-associated transporter subunit PqiC n=1 Tax=Geomonas terrae TaxID=2562681 RepID=A0A4S1CH51_9BACT|nr:PqiC family protein [Geomonas terrae]TGU72406.1 membrane integrity-associated transporter subunit PqiC [Geomonas terrae]